MLQADPPLQTVTVRVEPEEGFPSALRVDLNTTRYSIQNVDETWEPQVAEFGAGGLLAWMRACGVEGDEARLFAEAESVARRILGAPQFGLDPVWTETGGRHVASGGAGPAYDPDTPRVFAGSHGSRISDHHPILWLKAARISSWLLLWLAGVVYFLGRGRKRTAARDDGAPTHSVAQ